MFRFRGDLWQRVYSLVYDQAYKLVYGAAYKHFAMPPQVSP